MKKLWKGIRLWLEISDATGASLCQCIEFIYHKDERRNTDETSGPTS